MRLVLPSYQTFLDTIDAIREHDAVLAEEFAAMSNAPIVRGAIWLSEHFPRDWGSTAIVDTPQIIRNFPRHAVIH